MNRAFEQLGIDAAYAAFPVAAARLPEAVAGLKALGVAGANVTYPHKEGVIRFIDRPSPRVAALRAANTLCFTRDGTYGHNTDATGTAIALERFAGLVPRGKRVVIFGAGGAARAAALGLLEAGAAAVTLLARNAAKAEAATWRFKERFSNGSISILSATQPEARDKREAAIRTSDVLINATPIGMQHANAAPDARQSSDAVPRSLIEDPNWIRREHCCFDFVYQPPETEFLRAARAGGAACLGGLCLLVAQASESFRHWTGREFDLEEMARALEAQAADDDAPPKDAQATDAATPPKD
jgi:shikimate dehydrogenase